VSYGEVTGEPIAEFLGWEIKESQSGFSNRQTMLALLMQNEDGSPWQAKLNLQFWDAKKDKHTKAYKAPKLKAGQYPPAYLPPIDKETREKLNAPIDGSFWDWVEGDPTIPIVLTEGGKKSLCALSHGHAAIALYGCDAGYSSKPTGDLELIPDLKRFCQPGRVFILAFDRDEKPETVERVTKAIDRLTWLLRRENDQIVVKIASWDGALAKGLDDLVVNLGAESLAEAIQQAKIPPREAIWQCLESHNYQLGSWKVEKVELKSPAYPKILQRATWDSNLELIGEPAERIGKSKGSKTIKIAEAQKYREFAPLANFDFKISKVFRDADGGGAELEVTWLNRSRVVRRKAIIKAADIHTVKDFRAALFRGLNETRSCIFKFEQLEALLQNRKARYFRNGGIVYRLTDRIGQQTDGTWVFDGIQFKSNGTVTTEKESGWVFNPDICLKENIPNPAIAPQSLDALPNLVKALQAFFSKETMPYVYLTMGFAVAGLHRQPIMEQVGELASLAIYGEKGGGKSTAHKAAASLYGLHKFTPSQTSESQFFEYSKSLSNLPIQWDDPIRQGEYARPDEKLVNTVLWKLFTGLDRAVRGNKLSPNTVVCLSSNRTLGRENAAIASRLISFIFPKNPVNRAMGHLLEPAFKQASGGLGQLLSIQYDHQVVTEHGNQLIEHLSEADSRNCNSLATLAFFTQKFCNLAGVDFDALAFIKTDVCPQTNEGGSGRDSLTDFLEKLVILQSENKIGDWNLTECDSRDGSRYLAIQMSSVWETFEERFKPNYGQSLIAQLAENAGGLKNQKRYFVASRDNAIAYQRALNTWEMNPGGAAKPEELKRNRQAKALLIPRAMVATVGFFPVPMIRSPMSSPLQPKSPHLRWRSTPQNRSQCPNPRQPNPWRLELLRGRGMKRHKKSSQPIARCTERRVSSPENMGHLVENMSASRPKKGNSFQH
jgi:Domain of unknown function (DUF3854)